MLDHLTSKIVSISLWLICCSCSKVCLGNISHLVLDSIHFQSSEHSHVKIWTKFKFIIPVEKFLDWVWDLGYLPIVSVNCCVVWYVPPFVLRESWFISILKFNSRDCQCESLLLRVRIINTNDQSCLYVSSCIHSLYFNCFSTIFYCMNRRGSIWIWKVFEIERHWWVEFSWPYPVIIIWIFKCISIYEIVCLIYSGCEHRRIRSEV